MPDMTRHLKRWLTDKVLREIGGEFEGVVAAVTEEPIRNRFTAQRTLEVVVAFDDGGFRLILNKTLLTKFITWFGPESDDWIGVRIRVFRRQVETKNAKGEGRTIWQRDVVCEDRHARAVIRRPAPASGMESERADAVEAPDVCEIFDEDVPESLVAFGRRR